MTKRLAVVTGAGSGIGKQIALKFKAAGDCLLLVDKDAAALEIFQREMQGAAGEISILLGDVANEQTVCDIARIAEAADVMQYSLIHCAGVSGRGLVHEMSLKDWNFILSTNLTGSFLVIRALLPVMIRRGGGSIVAIGSISASVIGAGGGVAAYEASKAGLLQLTRAVAAEYASFGIRANVIAPGRISTNFGENARKLEGAQYTSVRTMERCFTPRYAPLGRQGQAADVAELAAFLCSDAAQFITGANIVIDGGYTLF